MSHPPLASEPAMGTRLGRTLRSSEFWHWAGPPLLLLVEYLLISFLFDAWTLRKRAGWAWLGWAGRAAPLAVVVLVATWVLHAARLREEFERVRTHARKRMWPLLLANVPVYAGFLLTTRHVFATPASEVLGWPWVGAWALTGVASTVLLVIAPVEARALGQLVVRLRGPLLMGAAFGAVAFYAGTLSVRLWASLGELTVALVVAMLGGLTDHVVFNANESIVGTPHFTVMVAPICSGYEGIGLVAAFLSGYLWVARRDLVFPRALIVLPIAVVTIWLANAIRIVALIAIGSWWSREVAIGGFHSKAGWVFVCAVSLAFVLVTRHWHWLHRDRGTPDSAEALESPAAPYLLPLLTLIATHMLTGLFSSGFADLYVLAPLAATAVLFFVRRGLPRPEWPPSWHAPTAGAVVFGLWLWMEQLSASSEESGQALRAAVDAMPTTWSTLWLAGRVLGSTAVVPVVEELAFRGYLLRRLVSRDFAAVDPRHFTWLSFVLSSVAFGALHQRWLAGSLAGMVFAAVQYRRGRIGDAIVAHAVANGLISAAVLGGGQWSLWA